MKKLFLVLAVTVGSMVSSFSQTNWIPSYLTNTINKFVNPYNIGSTNFVQVDFYSKNSTNNFPINVNQFVSGDDVLVIINFYMVDKSQVVGYININVPYKPKPPISLDIK